MFKDRGATGWTRGGAALARRAALARPDRRRPRRRRIARTSPNATPHGAAASPTRFAEARPRARPGAGHRQRAAGCAGSARCSACRRWRSPSGPTSPRSRPRRRCAIDDPVRDEFRSQMIMPLALGADSGRRMGATARGRSRSRARPSARGSSSMATLGQRRQLRPDAAARRASARPRPRGSPAMVAGAVPLGRDRARHHGRHHARPPRRARRAAPARCAGVPRALRPRSSRSSGAAARLALDPRPITVDATPLRIRGTVGPSLYRSARAAGAPASAVQQYLRALGARSISTAAIAAGDEFDLIVELQARRDRRGRGGRAALCRARCATASRARS